MTFSFLSANVVYTSLLVGRFYYTKQKKGQQACIIDNVVLSLFLYLSPINSLQYCFLFFLDKMRFAWRRIDLVRRGVRLDWFCGRRDGCSSGPLTVSNFVLIAAKRSIMSGGGGAPPKAANYVVPVDEVSVEELSLLEQLEMRRDNT